MSDLMKKEHRKGVPHGASLRMTFYLAKECQIFNPVILRCHLRCHNLIINPLISHITKTCSVNNFVDGILQKLVG